jgi:hypothetical protein
MIWLLLATAVTNLALGFAAARFWGPGRLTERRPPEK